MKLIHFADLHLGIETHGTVNPETGLSTRVHDTLQAFDTIVERAISDRVDAVLFAGDAFKNRDPSPTLQREFARRIAQLANENIPIVLLMGNHDLPNVHTRAAAVDIYPVLDIRNVHVASQIDLHEIITGAGPLQVVTVPWISRSRLLANEDLRRMVEDQLLESIEDGISYRLHELTGRLDPEKPAVLLAHLTVQGATFGHERSIMLGQDLTVDPQALRVDAFDYVALGHIHKHQMIRAQPPVVYSGSPERVDFGEEAETKGFVVVDIGVNDGGRRTSWNFQELPARQFTTLRIDARGEDPRLEVERAIQRESGRISDAIVRCFVEVAAGSESLVTAREIRSWIDQCGPFAVAGVVIQAEESRQSRIELDDGEALDVQRMLDRWLEMRDFDDKLEERIRQLGGELILEHRERSS